MEGRHSANISMHFVTDISIIVSILFSLSQELPPLAILKASHGPFIPTRTITISCKSFFGPRLLFWRTTNMSCSKTVSERLKMLSFAKDSISSPPSKNCFSTNMSVTRSTKLKVAPTLTLHMRPQGAVLTIPLPRTTAIGSKNGYKAINCFTARFCSFHWSTPVSASFFDLRAEIKFLPIWIASRSVRHSIFVCTVLFKCKSASTEVTIIDLIQG
mmetsp:Transcript_20446/g.38123  ORF Transcript_20446/g.38123 Transcript_20446/m.38123 type:complete len:215 (-) Transcript_20446:1067-1711(-)